jgi:hypothetical protein
MMIFCFTPVLLFGALGLGAYMSGLNFGLQPLFRDKLLPDRPCPH